MTADAVRVTERRIPPRGRGKGGERVNAGGSTAHSESIAASDPTTPMTPFDLARIQIHPDTRGSQPSTDGVLRDRRKEAAADGAVDGPAQETTSRPASQPAPPGLGLGNGSAVPASDRAHFESMLGADFSGVRVHPQAPTAVRLGARAFTAGRDIGFAPGEWAPGTPRFRSLLGHELVHVLQQGTDGIAVQLQETADVEAEAAEAVDINALTNGDLIYYLVTADDWLAEHGSEKGAEYDSYAGSREWLDEERMLRCQLGHVWLADTSQRSPGALLQFVAGSGGQTEIVAVDPAAASAMGREQLAGPIITVEQFDSSVAAGTFVLSQESIQPSEGESQAAGSATAQALPLAPPLLRDVPMPRGTALEGPVALRYYPGAVTAPPNTAKFDLISGGTATYYLTTERKRPAEAAISGPGKTTVVNQVLTGADVVSIKGPQINKTIEEMNPDWVKHVVAEALNKWVNKEGNPRTSTGSGEDFRIFAESPQSLTIHIEVPEEALARYPDLQQAADAQLAENRFVSPDIPLDTAVRVSGWQRRLPALGPGRTVAAQGLAGGVIAAVIGDVCLLFNAEDHPDLMRDLAVQTAQQGVIGVTASTSQTMIEEAVKKGGARILSQEGAALLGRAGGAGFVGAGLEVYDLWNSAEPVSEEEAFLRISRKAAIGVASNEVGFLAGAATVGAVTAGVEIAMLGGYIGAAAGSWAPVVGTVVGFVVGLAVGAVVGLILEALIPVPGETSTGAPASMRSGGPVPTFRFPPR